MARTVSQSEDDGFWRVSGQPSSEYYATRATAVRVAANLDAADLPTSSAPSTGASETAQDTAITAAAAAAAAASTAAGTAEGDAQTASNMASNALSAAGLAASAAAAAATAASTAQTTAATAAGAASVLAAELVPTFFDEIWRARFKELSPLNPVFSFETLNRQGGDGDGSWAVTNGATGWQDHPLSVRCIGAGQQIRKPYTRSVLSQRLASWLLAGGGYWIGDTIDGAGDRRGFGLYNTAGTLWLSMGTHTANTTHFSFNLKGGDPGGTGNILVPSTVLYVPGFHTVEMRYDVTTGHLQGSVDGEPWITLTTNPADMPDGPLFQNHGCFEGTGEIWLALAAVGTSL
ncbi:MAG TPA: hypothetical protein VNH17_09700 [Streptosporangiaceae bacterium]|nr:hypothetical protein [Streptosporangiaceae bacterium]